MRTPPPPLSPASTSQTPAPPFHGGRIIQTALVAQGLGMGLFSLSAPLMTSLQAGFGAGRRAAIVGLIAVALTRLLLLRLPAIEPGSEPEAAAQGAR